ncbi:hypothetical protein TPA0909_53380 [Streptomyces albus]|nr:hypothetical protein TPA0909_53380 [Streptomyces albus]
MRVRELSAADLEEIYPVRAGLEQIAAELAVVRLAGDVTALRPHVEALYDADRRGDGEAQVRHTVAFHRELVRAAGNSVLLHTWEGLGIEVWTALSIRWLGTVQQSYAEEHEAVLAAIERRDPGIGPLVKEHVLGCAPAPR